MCDQLDKKIVCRRHAVCVAANALWDLVSQEPAQVRTFLVDVKAWGLHMRHVTEALVGAVEAY